MRSNLYQKIGAVFDADARQRQKYAQMFLAWSGYLLPVMLLVLAFYGLNR